MRKILIIRLSAIGDVAMLIPIVYALCKSNPKDRFVLMTQAFLVNLMIDAPENLEFMIIDTKHEEKNLWGLLKYSIKLRYDKYDLILDMHNVLRTKVIRKLLDPFSLNTFIVNKNRTKRRQLLNNPNADINLTPMIDNYIDVIKKSKLNLIAPVKFIPIKTDDILLDNMMKSIDINYTKSKKYIGIAPIASKKSKTIDNKELSLLIEKIIQNTNLNIFIFCAKGKELESILPLIEIDKKRIFTVAGKFDLKGELEIISKLKCMISMDSANMHFASMIGIPVISFWAGTSVKAGFLGLGQSKDDIIESKNITCRPCSIFGSDNCKKNIDFECTKHFDLDKVLDRIKYYTH